MKIGIFGGSFDPIHNEHVQLAKSAIESLELDRLFVMPAHTPPHKKGKVLSSDEDRIEMCKRAFFDLPQVVVSDYEIAQGGTSYTVLTCRHFKEEYPNAQLYFLVGTDMLRNFPTWREPREILTLARLAVCARNEGEDWLEKERAAFFALFQTDFSVIRYHGRDVSSTKIRTLAAAGERLSAFLPPSIEAYVQEKGLYAVPFAQEALALEKPSRREHSVRVALYAAERAGRYKIDERKAVTAALFHDCAKNLPHDSPLLDGFISPEGVPEAVWHQFAGAYLAEKRFGVRDEDVLNAIRYHTSGRAGMSDLEKLVYLSDMLEEGRTYGEVVILRKVLEEKGLQEGFFFAFERSRAYLLEKGAAVYALTEEACEYEEEMAKRRGQGSNEDVF